MLDNLRDQASDSPFFKDEEPIVEKTPEAPATKKSIDQMTGMTPKQRFVIAVMLLVVICLLGSMVLLVLGRFSLPF